jgi:antitoxin ParD1/3/4
MSKVEKISVAITSELAQAVRVAVETGDYASSSEVIRDALRDWTEKRERRAAAIARLRSAFEEGLASGEPVEREPIEEFFARNRARLAAMKRG